MWLTDAHIFNFFFSYHITPHTRIIHGRRFNTYSQLHRTWKERWCYSWNWWGALWKQGILHSAYDFFKRHAWYEDNARRSIICTPYLFSFCWLTFCQIFGHVASIAKFKHLDEVITHGNNTTYGLAAAIHTKNIKTALGAAKKLKAGTVWVNTYNSFHFALPFGGFKESGIGRELGKAALANYTQG